MPLLAKMEKLLVFLYNWTNFYYGYGLLAGWLCLWRQRYRPSDIGLGNDGQWRGLNYAKVIYAIWPQGMLDTTKTGNHHWSNSQLKNHRPYLECRCKLQSLLKSLRQTVSILKPVASEAGYLKLPFKTSESNYLCYKRNKPKLRLKSCKIQMPSTQGNELTSAVVLSSLMLNQYQTFLKWLKFGNKPSVLDLCFRR